MVPMRPHAWLDVLTHGCAWSRIVMCDHTWLYVVICNPARSCVVMRGYAWSCVITRDHACIYALTRHSCTHYVPGLGMACLLIRSKQRLTNFHEAKLFFRSSLLGKASCNTSCILTTLLRQRLDYCSQPKIQAYSRIHCERFTP